MSNKSHANRYVVDVSDLIHWQGHLSGIQRVVAEMAYRYENEGAAFCYYEEATQQFYPLDSFVGHMKQREEARTQLVTAPVSESSTRKMAVQLKRIGRSLAPPIALKVAKRIRSEVSSNVTPAVTDARSPFVFKKEDTLLVFGGHWDKPHYTAVLKDVKQRGVRIAHMVYDLIPVYDKGHVAEEEHTRFPLYIKSISEISDLIYVISEATRGDYLRFLKENKVSSHPKVHKVILGENFSHETPTKPKGFKEQSYILAVGTFEVRKNYGLLYATYKRANELGVSLPKLVIVGRQGWLSGDMYYQMVHDASVSSNILFMHDINDHELSWLYENCLFTAYPSFYEGWGLPVAEAAFYGKTCAASDSSSIPEVVGDCALYFSPYSADECLATLQKLLDKKVRENLEAKLAKRQSIDWDVTFDQVKSAL